MKAHKLLLIAAMVGLSFSPAMAKAPLADGDTVNILWIGNSYTYFNDLPTMMKDIASTRNIVVNNTKLLKGGERWAGHLANKGVVDTIAMGGWDYVVLQEFSSNPSNSTKYVAENVYPYALKLDSLVHEYSPDAETVLYMTWGHREGNVRPTSYPLDDTYESMQNRLTTSYIDLAYDLDAMCAPVGMAWQTLRKDYPDIELYVPDKFHPSLEGSWLGANTIFATLYQKPFTSKAPEGIPSSHAEIMQKVAQQTVEDNAGLLNLNRTGR